MKNFFKKGTFRPNKKIKKGTKQFELQKYINATLGSGNLEEAVKLPPGEDINEWLAVNTVDFYNQINLIYGTITSECTAESCPVMNAGSKYEYLWPDKERKKLIRLSAPEYIEKVMEWIENYLDDEKVFPSKQNEKFPKNFHAIIKNIFKRLFRVYAHIYYAHFEHIVKLGEEAHLNTSFKHFMLFVNEFKLVEKKEQAPLKDLIQSLLNKDKKRKT